MCQSEPPTMEYCQQSGGQGVPHSTRRERLEGGKWGAVPTIRKAAPVLRLQFLAQKGPKSKTAKWAETPLSLDFGAIFGCKPHFALIFGHFLGNFDILADLGRCTGCVIRCTGCVIFWVYGLAYGFFQSVRVAPFYKCTGCAIQNKCTG